MTAILAAGGYVPPPVATVQLSNQDLSETGFQSATCAYVITNDGTARDRLGDILERWLLTGANSDFEVMATIVSGSPDGTFGSWLNCSTSRSWSITATAPNNYTSRLANAQISVQLRDVATQTVRASATISLSAEADGYQ